MNVEKYLSNYYKGTKNPSLEAMKYFMEEFNHPEKKLKFIHIAGTNGKGSTVEMLTNILIKAGYKVGKFISPHLIKYNERISIQNENISNENMEKLILKIKPKIEEYNNKNNAKITLFELITTMAILYFYENNCDIVVLETGLGGLYDCTNIVNPIVSIITSIGYDHMHILGNTLEEIAIQKAGIIKEKSSTIFVKNEDDSVNKVIIDTCKNKNNKLHLINDADILNYSYNKNFQKFDYKNHKDILVNLKGIKQIYNAAICLECVDILNNKSYNIQENKLKEGLKTVIHRARFETISKKPLIIYDGAHNKPAIENLNNSIDMYYKDENKVFIISILNTKDYKSIINLITKNKNSIFIFTDGNDKNKYVSKEELLNLANKYINRKNLYAMNLIDAINVIKNKNNDKISFIVGSFYIYGDVINYLK